MSTPESRTAPTTAARRADDPAVRGVAPADDALARRAQDLEELRQAEHESAFSGDLREMTGELSTVDQHPADVADFTYQRELQLTTQGLLERQSEQVQAALRARQQGTYGTCSDCGQPIPPERLAARPEATLCIGCQQRAEGPH